MARHQKLSSSSQYACLSAVTMSRPDHRAGFHEDDHALSKYPFDPIKTANQVEFYRRKDQFFYFNVYVDIKSSGRLL
jgi:hypothetical protein